MDWWIERKMFIINENSKWNKIRKLIENFIRFGNSNIFGFFLSSLFWNLVF